MDTATSTFCCPPPTPVMEIYTHYIIQRHVDKQMGLGSLAGAGTTGLVPTQDVPRPPGQGSAPRATKPSLRAALGGWALAYGGLPPSLGCFWPPSSSSRGSQGGTGLGAGPGAQLLDGGQSPASPVAPGTFPRGAWPAQGPLADSRGGKGVRLQVWAPPEGDPTGALPPGSSLGRRERSCHALGEPNTVLVSGKWSTTSSEAQAGRGEGAALI